MRTGKFLLALKKQKGLLRSRLIYDLKPGAHRRLLEFYSHFINVGDICFDLGAHTGNHSAAWLELGARVVAIEPQPVFADLMQRRFASNNNIKILQLAVADKQGSLLLKINTANPTISTLSDKWTETMLSYDNNLVWEEEIEVGITSLDELIKLYGIPAFCKIDVEGYEEHVLAGLSKALPALSFEFFPTTPDRTLQCIDYIELLENYRYNYSFTEHYEFELKEWIDAAEMKNEMMRYRGEKSGDIYAFTEPFPS